MLLSHPETNRLIRIVDADQLMISLSTTMKGRGQSGEEEQEVVDYAKSSLRFESGEPLPQCWTDPDHQLEGEQ